MWWWLCAAVVLVSADGVTDRAEAIDVLRRIADPVLQHLSTDTLRKNMTIEASPYGKVTCKDYPYAEAYARLMTGLAPWLELGPDDTAEGKIRAEYIDLVVRATTVLFTPTSHDFVHWDACTGMIVESAFVGHAILRAPQQFWGRLPPEIQQSLVANLQLTFKLGHPTTNNWVNFPSILQAALWYTNSSNETNWIEQAVEKQEAWYVGDGAYGDGPHFHWDHYNSYVMHPMIVDVIRVAKEKGHPLGTKYDCLLRRMQRYGLVQERMIHPDGSYLLVGRSAHYRFGAFQALTQLALQGNLPHPLTPGQVRTGLAGIIRKFNANDKNFLGQWLAAGVNGHQPHMMNGYGDTGSLYLVSVGLLHLGLPPTDPLWVDPASPCTQAQVWQQGDDLHLDEAMDGKAC